MQDYANKFSFILGYPLKGGQGLRDASFKDASFYDMLRP